MKKQFIIFALFLGASLFSNKINAQDTKYYFVQNFWTKTYLFGGQDFGCGGKTTTPEANSWTFEPTGDNNTYRIKHTDSGNYLNIENGTLDYGEIQEGWLSAQWVIEPVKGCAPNCYRIRSVWKPTLYLNNEKVSKTNGVECTTSSPNFHSSYWILDDGF